jgi:hypothetical protein
VPRVGRHLVTLERTLLNVERLHFRGKLPSDLGRDFERLSANGHYRRIGMHGRFKLPRRTNGALPCAGQVSETCSTGRARYTSPQLRHQCGLERWCFCKKRPQRHVGLVGCAAAIRVRLRIASHIDAPECGRLPHLFCSRLGFRRRPGAEMAGVSERPASSAGTGTSLGCCDLIPGGVFSVGTNSNAFACSLRRDLSRR